jgi:hypothetical protein
MSSLSCIHFRTCISDVFSLAYEAFAHLIHYVALYRRKKEHPSSPIASWGPYSKDGWCTFVEDAENKCICLLAIRSPGYYPGQEYIMPERFFTPPEK